MRWYFLSDTQEQIPTTEDQLAGLVGSGLLRAQSLVWPEGTADWKTLGELKPELFSGQIIARSQHGQFSKPTASAAAHQLTRPLTQRYGWLVTCGGLLLVLGVAFFIVAVLGGVGVFRLWSQQNNPVDGLGSAGVSIGWQIANCVMLVFQGVMAAWMGLQIILGANQLRQGQLLGVAAASETGLQALGKFFSLFVVTISVSVLYGLIIFWAGVMTSLYKS